MSERLYTLDQAAGRLGMSHTHVYKLVRLGYLRTAWKTTGGAASTVRHVTLRQVRDAQRRWEGKPDGWMTTREALDCLGVSDVTLRRYVRQYGIPSRTCRGRHTGYTLAYPAADITWLKEQRSQGRLTQREHLSPPLPARTPEVREREARMRRWLDEQEQDRREREQAEAERWALFPIRLAAQRQAIAEGKRRLAEMRKEEP